MQIQYCDSPRFVYNKHTGQVLLSSCGHCPSCLSNRQRSWTDRILLESDLHKYSFFFTLTFNDQHLIYPELDSFDIDNISDWFAENCSKEITSQALATLNTTSFPIATKECVQKWLKRLRFLAQKRYSAKIRYFLVSEYGLLHQRPHYHGILFLDSGQLAQNLHSLFSETWQFGFFDCSPTRNGCVGYCAKYINSIGYLPAVYLYPDFRPFFLSSRNPSIGAFEIGDESFSRFLFGEDYELFARTSSSFKNVSAWRSLENRVFPRLVGIGSQPCELRIARLSAPLFKDLIYDFVNNYNIDNITLKNSLMSDYYKLRLIARICEYYSIPQSVYAFFWDLYYYKKAQSGLSSFYSFQESFQEDTRYLINLYPFEYEKIKKCLSSESYLPYRYHGFLRGFGFTVSADLLYGNDVESACLLNELYSFRADNCPSVRAYLERPKKIMKHDENLRILNESYLF